MLANVTKSGLLNLLAEASGRISPIELRRFKIEAGELLAAAYQAPHANEVPSFLPLALRIIAAMDARGSLDAYNVPKPCHIPSQHPDEY